MTCMDVCQNVLLYQALHGSIIIETDISIILCVVIVILLLYTF